MKKWKKKRKNEKKWNYEKKKKEKMKKRRKKEKMKKMKKEKMKKKMKKREKIKKWKNEKKWKKKWKKWIHTQNPRRFPGFTVVVVTFFVKILDDFHDFVLECVSFPRKINNPFWEGNRFFRSKVTIFIGRETKTHILQTKMNGKKSLRWAHLTIIILLE